MGNKNISNHVKQSPRLVKLVSYTLLIVTATISVVVVFYLYLFTQNLLSDRLYERMEAIASTSSILFEGGVASELHKMGGEESVKTDEYKDIVFKLKSIKEANSDITFAYIYGKTEDPNTVQFVADADVIALIPELNFNEDEVTYEGFPGSTYDVSDIPLLTENTAFEEVVVDDYFYETIWGTLMTAYAPIKNNNGVADTVLALDVDITDFNRLVKATFVPFGLFVVLLLLLLFVMTFTLIRMWGTRVEFMQELDKQKDELLSIVSHQLATPVSSMKWYLEMMLDGDFGKLSKEQKEHVESLQASASSLSDLVAMILDVSRIQLGRMKVDRSEVDLGEFFSEVITVIDAKAKEKKVEFIKKLPKKWPVAMQDKRLLHMTLENLLSNAVKYSADKKGKVVLDVNIENNTLHYSVTDNGLGIPKKEQGKVFDKLFRASNVQKIDGNGFGLFAAKGAVEALGGKISFDSQEGKGTTFTVSLPLGKKINKS